jgi:hypothetical protein
MSETQTIAPFVDLATTYQPTVPEREVLVRQRARKRAHPPSPRACTVRHDGAVAIGIEHPAPAVGRDLLMEALGTVDPDFLDGLLLQLGGAEMRGHAKEGLGLNFMLSMVKSIKPRDEIETMLAAQMAAVHLITMAFSRPLQAGRGVAELQDVSASFNRLARTFTTQIETLKRWRSVERQVTVEQVTVNDGGQAIVGQVEMTSAGIGGMAAAPRADENSPPTPWTEADAPPPCEAAAAAPQLSPPTPWTGDELAAVPGDAEVVSPEIPRPTPWTESCAPPSGLPPRPRRPGAYLQVLREKLAATP